jgi:ABC-type sugar transport system substrate-binding protein
MMYKWVAEGVEPPKDTRTPGILITRENFKKILTEQGIKEYK